MLLLCEVALGESKWVVKAKDFLKPPEYFSSVKGIGLTCPDPTKKTDFTEYLPEATGLTLSSGDLVANPELPEVSENGESELWFNEFIVYNES